MPTKTDRILARTAAAHGDFAEHVSAAVRACILAGRPFTTDDVWLKLEACNFRGLGKAERNAVGAVMRGFALRELVTRTDRTAISDRPSARHRRLMVWEPRMAARETFKSNWHNDYKLAKSYTP